MTYRLVRVKNGGRIIQGAARQGNRLCKCDVRIGRLEEEDSFRRARVDVKRTSTVRVFVLLLVQLRHLKVG